jgi:hypothetical protein
MVVTATARIDTVKESYLKTLKKAGVNWLALGIESGVKSDGENKGATFSFTLPVATPEVLKEAEKYHYKPEGGAKLLEPVAIQAFPNEPAETIFKS